MSKNYQAINYHKFVSDESIESGLTKHSLIHFKIYLTLKDCMGLVVKKISVDIRNCQVWHIRKIIKMTLSSKIKKWQVNICSYECSFEKTHTCALRIHGKRNHKMLWNISYFLR